MGTLLYFCDLRGLPKGPPIKNLWLMWSLLFVITLSGLFLVTCERLKTVRVFFFRTLFFWSEWLDPDEFPGPFPSSWSSSSSSSSPSWPRRSWFPPRLEPNTKNVLISNFYYFRRSFSKYVLWLTSQISYNLKLMFEPKSCYFIKLFEKLFSWLKYAMVCFANASSEQKITNHTYRKKCFKSMSKYFSQTLSLWSYLLLHLERGTKLGLLWLFFLIFKSYWY